MERFALQIPEREKKPRRLGRNSIIDRGPDLQGWMGLQGTRDFLEVAAGFVDSAKIYATQSAMLPADWLRQKIALYKSFDVEVYPGGILMEIAWLQGKVSGSLREITGLGYALVEISENYLELGLSQRRELVRQAQDQGLGVIYELGRKQPLEPAEVKTIVEPAQVLLEEGVSWIVLEQSEIDLLKLRKPERLREIVDALGKERVILEADQTDFPSYYLWLMETLGIDVNLGNISPGQLLRIEEMRRGIGRPVDFDFVRQGASLPYRP